MGLYTWVIRPLTHTPTEITKTRSLFFLKEIPQGRPLKFKVPPRVRTLGGSLPASGLCHCAMSSLATRSLLIDSACLQRFQIKYLCSWYNQSFVIGCLRNASNGDGTGLLLATYWYVTAATIVVIPFRTFWVLSSAYNSAAMLFILHFQPLIFIACINWAKYV